MTEKSESVKLLESLGFRVIQLPERRLRVKTTDGTVHIVIDSGSKQEAQSDAPDE